MKDYYELAREAVAAEEVARIEAAVAQRATSMRLADEREAQLAALRVEHGLHPNASPREVADAEIAMHHGYRDHVSRNARYWSGAYEVAATEVLAPEAVTDDRRRAAAEAVAGKLRKEFEKSWPPADLAGRLGATDGMDQSRGHATGVAA